MKMTENQLREVADVLRQIGEITKDTGIRFGFGASFDLDCGGNMVTIRWDTDDNAYYVDELA